MTVVVKNKSYSQALFLVAIFLSAAAASATVFAAAENNVNAAVVTVPATAPNPLSRQVSGRPKIALVLSGGGARGLAHIGVFKALEKMRIPYDCIVGTSMGAIAGGSFATGISVNDAETKVENAKWTEIFSDTPQRSDIPYFRKSEDYQPFFNFTLTLKNFKPVTPQNFVGVQNIGLFFRELTGARFVNNFDDLPVPYRAVGTDIVTGSPVILSDGTVAEAMRASMTVPGIFPPIPYKGHLLVDGGLSMNLPITVGRQLCGDVVIAVNVASPGLKQSELRSFFTIGEQVINISMQANVNEQLATLTPQDVLITPDLGGYTGTDFDKAKDLIRIGEKAVEYHASALARLQLSEKDYADWRSHIAARKPNLPVIDKVSIAKMAWVNADVMSDLLKIKPGNDFNMEALHKNISKIYARGDFSSISYDLVPTSDGKADILVTPEEKPGRDFVRFGLGLYTDFRGNSDFSALASLRRAWLNRLDGEWRMNIQVGRDNSLYSEWYQPASLGSEFFVAPYVQYLDQYTDVHFQHLARLSYEYQQEGGGVELGSVFGRWGEFRVGVMRAYATVKSQTLLMTPNENFQQGGYTLRTIYDQLDSTYFPHSGSSSRISYFKSSADLGADLDYDKIEFNGVHATTWNRNTLLLKGRAGSSLHTTLPVYNTFSLGGIFSVSAYPLDYLRGSDVASVSAILYRRISDLPAVLGRGIYGGAALEGGRIRNNVTGYSADQSVALSSSLFLAADTVLGPFYLLGAVGNNHQSALYLALGISF
jgi:NTE family protein